MHGPWRTSFVVGLFAVHTALLGWGATVHSPTLNEPGHLVAGVSIWRFGRFDIYSVNPPLVKSIAALPVMVAGCETDWSAFYEGPGARPEFSLGEDWMRVNGQRAQRLTTWARWACIPLSLLGGWVCYRWAGELYGPRAGLWSLALWCFCPNLLAHGQLITPDAGATALGVAAAYTFWRWLKSPTWWHTLLSGAVLGLAELAKTTLILFYPLWPALWVVYRWGRWQSDGTRSVPATIGREIGMLTVRTAVCLYVINLGYAFEGTFKRLGDYQFVSQTLAGPREEQMSPRHGNRFAGTWLASVPVPLPSSYVAGIDLQKRDFERIHRPSYLAGEFRERGWWYYYLYALAIKVPLGVWLLFGLALGVPFCGGQKAEVNCGTVAMATTWRDELVLLTPAVVVLGFVSLQTGFNEHMRYVLPIFPFVYVWLGRVAWLADGARRWPMWLARGALAWAIGSSLWVYPHSLSYFNELAGGPTGGGKHLLYSNIDWGQDLLYLRQWLAEHPEAKPLKLAYFGMYDPGCLGMEYEPLPVPPADEPLPPGWYAVSVNFVYGLPFAAYQGNGQRTMYPLNSLTRFAEMEPVARAGYSINIYRVP